MGQDDLAHETLTRRAAVLAQAQQVQPQRDALTAEEDKLTLAQQRLQAKVEAFRIRKETIKATYAAALIVLIKSVFVIVAMSGHPDGPAPRVDQANMLQKLLRRAAATRPVTWLLSRILPRVDTWVYQATSGRQTASGLLSGMPVVLLTTIGAKSGVARTVPVLGLPTADGLAVVGDNYGRHAHPGWYHNLIANPDATVHAEGTGHRVRARLVSGVERERLWQSGLRVYPGWAAYAKRAGDREIGIFLLSPADDA